MNFSSRLVVSGVGCLIYTYRKRPLCVMVGETVAERAWNEAGTAVSCCKGISPQRMAYPMNLQIQYTVLFSVRNALHRALYLNS